MKRAAAAALALAAAEAAAHAELVSSSPSDGAGLSAPPAELVLVFNEPVRVLSLTLVDAAARPVPLAEPDATGSRVRAAPKAALADGHYLLSYRVVSLDSHPIAGAIAFGVGAGPPPAPAGIAAEVSALRVAVRALRDFALLLAAGGALFALVVREFPLQRRLLVWAVALGVASTVAALALQGAGLLSSFALSAGVACLGLACIAAGELARRRALLGGGAFLALASLPLTGHTAGAPLAMAALAAHGLAAAFWLGSLGALLVLVRERNAAFALRRFSAFGVAAVAILLAAGIGLAALKLETLDALWQTDYGRLILAKGVLFFVLVGLALVNRFRLLPALERGARAPFERTIGAELMLISLVVALTALLVQTPPRGGVREEVLEAAGHTAKLSLDPHAVEVRLRDARGAPLEAAEVTLELSNPAAGVEALVRPMQRVGEGHYRFAGGNYAAPGWRVRVHARIGDFDKLIFER